MSHSFINLTFYKTSKISSERSLKKNLNCMFWQYQKIKYFLKKIFFNREKKGIIKGKTKLPQCKQINAQFLGFTHNSLGLSQEAWAYLWQHTQSFRSQLTPFYCSWYFQ